MKHGMKHRYANHNQGAGGVGDYMAPPHKSTRVRKNTMDDGDSAGVGSGLSALKSFDVYKSGPEINYNVNEFTGNAQEREPKNPRVTYATSKGNKFELE